MADSSQTKKAPHGMESYDLGALNNEQQAKLNHFKIKTRVENEKYLRDHPEVETLIGEFLGDVLTKRPQNIQEFAAEYFTQPGLSSITDQLLENRHACMKQNKILQHIG